MDRPHAVFNHRSSPSMVVNDLDIFGAGRSPAKTQAVLIVHSDAVLSCAAALQAFMTITRRRTQELQGVCSIQLGQFARRDFGDARKPLALTSLEQRLRVGAAEAPNHASRV